MRGPEGKEARVDPTSKPAGAGRGRRATVDDAGLFGRKSSISRRSVLKGAALGTLALGSLSACGGGGTDIRFYQSKPEVVGYFDTIEQMHTVYDRYKGHTALTADALG
mgnify:CR=1 FL=1